MNQWKSAHAIETEARSLADAMNGADVFFGLSVKGAVTAEMVANMADQPIIFAMANPDPEITPEEVKSVRKDAIMATGRSDYPNQINNVLGFPYIFRGALDVRASEINEDMKVAAAHAIAQMAREDVPDEVAAAYSGRRLRYGPEYIIPVPFDPRLISFIPPAVAQAAMDSGVAQKPIIDMDGYRAELASRLDPTAASMQTISAEVAANHKRIVFAEGEEEKVIRAAVAFRNAGYGIPVLVGREDRIKEQAHNIGLGDLEGMDIQNARLSLHTKQYTDHLFNRVQRSGMLYRDCQRLVNQDRNVFAASMVACGDADALVTGVTRHSHQVLSEITKVLKPRDGERIFGLAMLLARGRTVFIADTNVHELPSPQELADIAQQSANHVRRLGYDPRVAFLSASTFGSPANLSENRSKAAVDILDQRQVDFEYEGEMGAHVALDPHVMKDIYPFCRLTGPANILIMPGLHSANITTKVMQKIGGGTVIGPLTVGLERPAQIVSLDATVTDIVNLAVMAAHEAIKR
jgi:malate dehydrogenase (oxaloacetate-decarboxylating)(NADP+)